MHTDANTAGTYSLEQIQAAAARAGSKFFDLSHTRTDARQVVFHRHGHTYLIVQKKDYNYVCAYLFNVTSAAGEPLAGRLNGLTWNGTRPETIAEAQEKIEALQAGGG